MKPLPEPAWTDVPRVDATDADELPGVNCIARTPDARSLPQHRDWAQAARDAMSRYGNGGTYVNFTGEGSADVTHKSYPPETYARLQHVKDRYDPDNMFRFNQNVHPSAQ